MSIWYAVKLDTTNGQRIGISEDPEVGEVLDEFDGGNALDHAEEKAQVLSERPGIPMWTEEDTMYLM